MKQISLLNCVISIVSLSCLGIIGLILFGIILFQKTYDKPSNIVGNESSSQNSHLPVKSKPIESVIALVSDSESDWETLSKVVEGLDNKLIPNAIHLGDITHLGVVEDFIETKEITDNSSVQFYFVPGDRDLWKSSGVSNFNEILGENYGLVTIGSSNFLLVDNSNEYEGLDQAQWDFIEANIDKADYVVLHNPIYFSDSLLGLVRKGMGQYSASVEDQRVRLLSLIRDSTVKAVFAGDQHLFSESADIEKPELNHYVVGALSADRNIQQSNYVLLTLYTDGDYHVEQVYLMSPR